jgi:MSHA pilin protein MshB
MNSKIHVKKSSGFTLIELVIVVVILGFLAVTAIPKFLDLTEQAKQANIEGMAGGFATGISLARAQWEAEGRQHEGSGATRLNVTEYDGTKVYLTVEVSGSVRPGYILGTTSASLTSAVNCVEVWNAILQQPPSITTTDLTIDSSVDYFATKDTNNLCHYFLRATLVRSSSTLYDSPGTDPLTSTTVGNSFTYNPANSLVTVHINN